MPESAEQVATQFELKLIGALKDKQDDNKIELSWVGALKASEGNDERESRFISELTAEARELKDCFARYSFQGVGLSAAVLAIIARYQQEMPYVGLAAFPVIVMLIALARMGTHKYTSVNRITGYELHLQRTRSLKDDPNAYWRSNMRDLGWEEAMRAWRIVQTTVYQCLYETNEWKLEELKPELRKRLKEEKTQAWFLPQSSTNPAHGTSYYSGSYLRKSLEFIYTVIVLSFIPPIITVGQLFVKHNTQFWELAVVLTLSVTMTWFIFKAFQKQILPINNRRWKWITRLLLFMLAGLALRVLYLRVGRSIETLSVAATLVVVSIYFGFKVLKVENRRVVLEDELLSIHSCTVVWQAVVVAHYRALEKAQCREEHYLGKLAEQAASLKKRLEENVNNIYQWIDGEPPENNRQEISTEAKSQQSPKAAVA